MGGREAGLLQRRVLSPRMRLVEHLMRAIQRLLQEIGPGLGSEKSIGRRSRSGRRHRQMMSEHGINPARNEKGRDVFHKAG